MEDYKNKKARTMLYGLLVWVGGELLFHASAQYHRRGGA